MGVVYMYICQEMSVFESGCDKVLNVCSSFQLLSLQTHSRTPHFEIMEVCAMGMWLYYYVQTEKIKCQVLGFNVLGSWITHKVLSSSEHVIIKYETFCWKCTTFLLLASANLKSRGVKYTLNELSRFW